MLNLEKIGSKITTLRKKQKMTQNELAETLFVTHQAVSKWENGKSIPGIEILYELTKLFKISIDYLLDNTEIVDDDYESLFKNYSRDVVIAQFMKSKTLCDDFNKIFYLLKNEERKQIIDRVTTKNIDLTIDCIWPYLNKQERSYLLAIILTGKCDFNLQPIYNQLTQAEEQTVQKHYNDGLYQYRLPPYKIRSWRNEKKRK